MFNATTMGVMFATPTGRSPARETNPDPVTILNAQLADALAANAELTEEVKSLRRENSHLEDELSEATQRANWAERVVDLLHHEMDVLEEYVEDLRASDRGGESNGDEGCDGEGGCAECEASGEVPQDEVPAAVREAIEGIRHELAARLGVPVSAVQATITRDN